MPVASPHYVPDYALAIGGAPVPAAVRAAIAGVRFEEALEGAGRVEVEFANQALRLLDLPLFELGSRVELALGHLPAGPSPVFAGELTGVEAVFPAGQMPTVTLSAQDAIHRLTEGTKQRGFPWQVTDSVIAAIVAAENGLLAAPDPVGAALTGLGAFSRRPRFQHRRTDYQFLRRIATEYGFEMWVEGDVLNFRPLLPGVPRPEIELRWGESLIEFAPRLTSVGQVISVRIKVWVEALKTQIAVEVAWDGARVRIRVRPTLFARLPEAAAATIELPDIPLETPVEAVKLALGELRRRLNTRTTASGRALGDPRFRVGRLVAVDGIGRQFSSRSYRLTSVAHTLDEAGYRTDFQVRREVV
jgi:phage protein D